MKLTASDIHVELGGNEILKGIDAAIKEKEFVYEKERYDFYYRLMYSDWNSLCYLSVYAGR